MYVSTAGGSRVAASSTSLCALRYRATDKAKRVFHEDEARTASRSTVGVMALVGFHVSAHSGAHRRASALLQ